MFQTTSIDNPPPPCSSAVSSSSESSVGRKYLLELPTETLLDLIEFLCCDSEPAFVRQNLGNLRRACKRFATLCTPSLFYKLSFSLPNLDSVQKATSFPPALGGHARHLILKTNHEPSVEGQIAAMCSLIAKTPNVRHLRVDFAPGARALSFQPLLETILSLEMLHAFDMQSEYEIPLPSGATLNSLNYPFVDALLYTQLCHLILTKFGRQLRTFAFGNVPMHPAAFNLLRDTTPDLRVLNIERALWEGLGPRFGESTRWACAQTLTHLTFNRCRGTHAAHIAKLVVGGTWPNLESLSVLACGCDSDDPELPGPDPEDKWELAGGRPLPFLNIDHSILWEMAAMRMIRCRILKFTRISTVEIAEVLAMKHSFLGLETLYASGWGEYGGTEADVLQAAVARKLSLVLGSATVASTQSPTRS